MLSRLAVSRGNVSRSPGYSLAADIKSSLAGWLNASCKVNNLGWLDRLATAVCTFSHTEKPSVLPKAMTILTCARCIKSANACASSIQLMGNTRTASKPPIMVANKPGTVGVTTATTSSAPIPDARKRLAHWIARCSSSPKVHVRTSPSTLPLCVAYKAMRLGSSRQPSSKFRAKSQRVIRCSRGIFSMASTSAMLRSGSYWSFITPVPDRC